MFDDNVCMSCLGNPSKNDVCMLYVRCVCVCVVAIVSATEPVSSENARCLPRSEETSKQTGRDGMHPPGLLSPASVSLSHSHVLPLLLCASCSCVRACVRVCKCVRVCVGGRLLHLPPQPFFLSPNNTRRGYFRDLCDFCIFFAACFASCSQTTKQGSGLGVSCLCGSSGE